MKGYKVKWDDVCAPKDEGGLGIKDIEVWNKASISKHLWKIVKNDDSLWVS